MPSSKFYIVCTEEEATVSLNNQQVGVQENQARYTKFKGAKTRSKQRHPGGMVWPTSWLLEDTVKPMLNTMVRQGMKLKGAVQVASAAAAAAPRFASLSVQSNPLNGSTMGLTKIWTNNQIEPLTSIFY